MTEELKQNDFKTAYYKLLTKYAELEKQNKELQEKHESSVSQWKYELNRSIHKETELAKEIRRLDKQIYKMRNCDNCTHCASEYKDEAGNSYCDDCNDDMSAWEMSLCL